MYTHTHVLSTMISGYASSRVALCEWGVSLLGRPRHTSVIRYSNLPKCLPIKS